MFDQTKAMAQALMADDRGQTGVNRGVGIIVTIVVTLIVAAFLVPVAIDEIVAVDTSNWSSGAQSLWDILDLIGVLVVFLFVLGYALR